MVTKDVFGDIVFFFINNEAVAICLCSGGDRSRFTGIVTAAVVLWILCLGVLQVSLVCCILLCGCKFGEVRFEDPRFSDFCKIGGFCRVFFFLLAFLVDMNSSVLSIYLTPLCHYLIQQLVKRFL